MTELYNLTGLKAAETIGDLFIVANNATNIDGGGGLLIGGFLIGIFIMMVLTMRKNDISISIMVSSFICFGLSIFLKSAGLVNFYFVIGFLAILAFSSLFVFMTKKD